MRGVGLNSGDKPETAMRVRDGGPWSPSDQIARRLEDKARARPTVEREMELAGDCLASQVQSAPFAQFPPASDLDADTIEGTHPSERHVAAGCPWWSDLVSERARGVVEERPPFHFVIHGIKFAAGADVRHGPAAGELFVNSVGGGTACRRSCESHG